MTVILPVIITEHYNNCSTLKYLRLKYSALGEKLPLNHPTWSSNKTDHRGKTDDAILNGSETLLDEAHNRSNIEKS